MISEEKIILPSRVCNKDISKKASAINAITVGHIEDGLRGAQLTKHMTGNERISFLEDLRQESAKGCSLKILSE